MFKIKDSIKTEVKEIKAELREFLQGEVEIVRGGFFKTTYKIPSTGAIIKVKNSIHLKMTKHKYTQITYPIIAIMTGVKLVSGNIPDDYILVRPLGYYSNIADEYY